MYKVPEKVVKAREERKKLIERAGRGDKKAQEILSKSPYFLKVYSDQEKRAYEDLKAEEDNHSTARKTPVTKSKLTKKKKKRSDS